MIEWGPDPICFNILGFGVRWYSVLFASGFAVGKIYVSKVLKSEKGLSEYDTIILLNYLILGAIIGGRIGHCLFYDFPAFLANPSSFFVLWNGGMSSHGGYLGILVTMWIYTRQYKNISMLWLLDVVAPSAALTGGMLRIGNLINSELIGTQTTVPWAIIFKNIDRVPRHPVQFYEAISYFLISIIGFYLFQRLHKQTRSGRVFGFVLAFSMLCRLFSEFFKVDYNIIGQGQLLSLPFIATGLFFMLPSKNESRG